MGYARVEETFWHDDKIRALSETARFFLMYLITCSHKNRLGCFVLDPFYAAADLQWERDRVEEAIQELAAADRIGYDAHNRVVFICRWLKHNTLLNKNVATAAIRDLRGLPDTPLLGLLLDALKQFKAGHYEDLISAVGERVDALGDESPETVVTQGDGNNYPNYSTNKQLGRVRSSTGMGQEEKGGSGGKDSPSDWMHDVWHEVFGHDAHPLDLTPSRRQKYEAMYSEQLKVTPNPEAAWRAVLYAVTKSSHHMSKRSYQMPESILRNADRRSRWVQEAIDVLERGPTEADRKLRQKQDEVLDFLRNGRAA